MTERMSVKELIAILERFDESAEVVLSSVGGGEWSSAFLEIGDEEIMSYDE